MADILAVLYGAILKIDPQCPGWEDRDRFILSKGHAAAVTYAVLAERGFFPLADLQSYCQEGSKLTGHVNHHVPGVEVSTGSLGHGLSIGTGIALAGKREGRAYRVFVLLSDGELDEGSNWEPILFAPHHHLDNLTVIVDCNRIQSFGTVKDVLDLEPLTDKWRAARWDVKEVDGHDLSTLENILSRLPFSSSRPSVIIARTVKGKGVSFMENDLLWHYRAPNRQQLAQALGELGYAE
jgi:transketolase